MITVRKSEERRYVDVKDQKTWMTFDAENKSDPLQKGYGVLKVLNEEILSPGGGFVLQSEKDMVVVTYVHEGVIVYKAPLEEPTSIEAKEFNKVNVTSNTKQYAFNTSPSDDAEVFQCGFALEDCAEECGDGDPKTKGAKKLFTHAERQGVLRLIASSDGREASLPIQQDIQIYSTFMHSGNHIVHELKPSRSAWLHVVKGKISLESLQLQTGDGAGLTEERSVSFTAKKSAEILLFDLCEAKTGKAKESPDKKLELAKIP
jgi:redox-sensitive bicupin YhaK (pirin superfamily)